MKILLYLLLLLMLALPACQESKITPTKESSIQRSPTLLVDSTEELTLLPVKPIYTSTEVDSPSATFSPLPTLFPSPTTSPTPVIQIDLSRFDPDLWPAIDVSHNPPLIARSDETIKLDFNFLCRYSFQVEGLYCNFDKTLLVSYGESNDFIPVPLEHEIKSDTATWTATLPATNVENQPLRYYLQVNDPQVGLDVRYPIEGTIDLFTVHEFISIDLPAQKPVEQGELALSVPWGSGPEEVGLRKRDGYPAREGPLALDVAEDGRIALLDFVNERVLIYDPKDQSYSSIPLLFTLKNQGDIQFDQNGQITVLDPVGEPMGQSTVKVPQLYRLLPDGRINAVAPVFASIPAWLMKDLRVFDLDYSKIVVPFSPSGEVNTREAQRLKQPAEFLAKYMTDTVHEVRLADTKKGIAFAVHSVSPLGAITYFEKTPQGYITVFEGDQIRAIWFDASGVVLQDIILPRDDYSEVNSLGRIAVDPQGSLYVMGSTARGIEVRFVEAP
jgi:hypothetical protein